MYTFDTNGGSFLDNYKSFYNDPIFSNQIKGVGQTPYQDLYGYNSSLINRNSNFLVNRNLKGGNSRFDFILDTTYDDGTLPTNLGGNLKNLVDNTKFYNANKNKEAKGFLPEMLERMGVKVNPRDVELGIDSISRLGRINAGNNFDKALNAGQFAYNTGSLLGYNLDPRIKTGLTGLEQGAVAFDSNQTPLTRLISGGQGAINLANTGGFSTNPNYGNILDIAGAGNSLYNLFDNYKYMSPGERIGATFQTINQLGNAYKSAGQLYNNSDLIKSGVDSVYSGLKDGFGAVKDLYNSAVSSTGSVTSGVSGSANIGTTTATTTPTAGILENISGYASGAASLYGLYQLGSIVESGKGGARGRSSGAAAGASAGSFFGPVGMAVGAALGTGLGSIKHGRTVQDSIRSDLLENYAKVGIFDMGDKLINPESKSIDTTKVRDFAADKSKITKDTVLMQLADGTYSRIDLDGSKNQVFDFKNPDKLPEDLKKNGVSKRHFYDIDITNDFDVSASNMLTGLHHMMVGGSLFKDTNDKTFTEKSQMKGYMTNGILSNLDSKDMTQGNFNKVVDNARLQYERAGIKAPADGISLLEKMVSEGRLSKEDYKESLRSMDMVFNKNYNTFKGAEGNIKTKEIQGAKTQKVLLEEQQTQDMVNSGDKTTSLLGKMKQKKEFLGKKEPNSSEKDNKKTSKK